MMLRRSPRVPKQNPQAGVRLGVPALQVKAGPGALGMSGDGDAPEQC